MKDIYELIADPTEPKSDLGDEYNAKYIHDVPDTRCFQREQFILALCKNKTVLHIGSNGPFNARLEKEAKRVICVDIDDCDNNAKEFHRMDVEKHVLATIATGDVDIVLAADILEHLSNPGLFLKNLQTFNCKIIISVPNATGKILLDWMAKGKENVHKDHVAWYSYNTFKALIERYDFNIDAWYWYNGLPRIAEGLIFVVSKKGK
jgi:2-polyprenyl-3-methyl-5-hydroxy-6-metoxy-1,4-benzoquinol methylase